MKFINGKKTYIVAALGVGVSVAKLFGLVEPEIADCFLGLIGFGAAATIRNAIKK